MDEAALDDLAGEIRGAETVGALTGAGVSTASGIPDFRSEGGIWEAFDEADFRYSRFRADPEGFWRDRLAMREWIYGRETIEPNAAHEALAAMERAGHLAGVATQNVDGLHEAAGTETVIHLHGTGERASCLDCARRLDGDAVFERVEAGEVPPRCESCDGLLKPDTVLFGEPLPRGPLNRAEQLAREADVFLSVGSSLRVEPAASLPVMAHTNGASVADVNLEETRLAGRATYEFRTDVTDVLPALEARL